MPREFTLVTRRGNTPLPSDTLPSAFKIFGSGRIETTEGTDVFDAEAAREVMRRWREQGSLDLPVDLEHRSLDGTRSADSTDALGWFRPELRADGSLWAVVKWNAEGERRLRGRLQRFISPAFRKDPATNRILELVNCALVALPATHGAEPLMAASKLGRKNSTMVSGRTPLSLRDSFQKTAEDLGWPAGVFVRGLIVLATRSPESMLKNFRVALRLGKDATVEEIRAALDKLIEELDADVPVDPTNAGGADPAPADAVSALSRREEYTADGRRVRYAHEFVGRSNVRHVPPSDGDESKLDEYDRAKANEIKDPEKRAKFVALRLSRAKGNR